MVCLWLSIPNGIVYWNKYMFHSYTSVLFLDFPDKKVKQRTWAPRPLNWIPLTSSVKTNTRLRRAYFPGKFWTAFISGVKSLVTTSNFVSKGAHLSTRKRNLVYCLSLSEAQVW